MRKLSPTSGLASIEDSLQPLASTMTLIEFEQPQQLALFKQRLPKKPYHTDILGTKLRIADVQRAVAAKYIQHNGPTHCYWLVFDVDRPTAALDWSDRNCPPPTFTVQNPSNGHAHLFYALQLPVRTAPDGSGAALRYASAIENALRAKLDADPGYTGLISKNPLNPWWRVAFWCDHLYSLGDLDSWLDLDPYKDKRKKLPDYGLGRNCTLFERLSKWAYRAIRQGWPEYEQWQRAVLDRASGYNDFDSPLPASEVRATAKSVARWTHKHLSQEGFSKWQSVQGAKGGKKSKRGAVSDSERTLKPWEKQGISRAQWYRDKNGSQK